MVYAIRPRGSVDCSISPSSVVWLTVPKAFDKSNATKMILSQGGFFYWSHELSGNYCHGKAVVILGVSELCTGGGCCCWSTWGGCCPSTELFGDAFENYCGGRLLQQEAMNDTLHTRYVVETDMFERFQWRFTRLVLQRFYSFVSISNYELKATFQI